MVVYTCSACNTSTQKLRQEAYSEFEVTQVNLDENMKFSVGEK